MNKLFLENTKSDSHNETLSVFTSEQPKDKANMTVGIGINEITENIQEEQVTNPDANEEIKIETEEPTQEENLEEIKEKPKKEEKIKSPIWIKLKNNRYKIILTLLVILIILGIIFIPKLKKEEEQVPVIENVRMIQVVGLTSEEATQKIDELGLEIQYEYEEVDDETQVGKVLEQSIQENQEVAKGTTVTIKIAVSKQKVTVPNVVEMNINDAIQTLTSMGLLINATGQYSSDVEKDIIISQMTLEGEEVNLGTTIEVLVSLGKEQVEEEQPQTNTHQNSNANSNTPTTNVPSTNTPPANTQQPETPTVVQPVELRMKNATSFVEKGKTFKFTTSVYPENAVTSNIIWSIDNSRVGNISQDGVFSATADGSTTIIATMEGTNLKATYGVTVYIVGDVNADGKVNSSDSDMILQWYMANVELTEERVLRGDANRDNAVNSLDALYILDVLQYQYK